MSRSAASAERALGRLRLKQLQLLIAVGQHENIRSAAQALHISQPAATRMIKDMEADLGADLFQRTNRGALPTAQGAVLIHHAQVIFTQLGHAAQEMGDLTDGAAGRVVIGTLVAGAAQLLPMAIARVLNDRPNITFKVIEGTNEVLMPRLRSGEIDMVLGRLPTHRHRRDLHQERLSVDSVYLIAGRDHPLADQRGLSFDDLKPFGWILPPPETTLRRQIEEVFVDQGQYQPPMVVESVSYLTNRTLLQNSQMIGIAPRHAVDPDRRHGALVRLEYILPFGSGPTGVTHRGTAHLSPAAQVLLEALRAEADILAGN
ncbi:LysR substrate-binding domain-containing protein [Gymnodinialimonas sp. 2305UL16-5]|uniref:LysR substrate-binding domain-containing protein n=1 Tax=Gymnodinialimonas mytili TaxID=3126503 RepID=UPI0030B36E51